MRVTNDKKPWWSAAVGNETLTSEAQSLGHLFGYNISAQFVLGGATTATAVLQASNDGENWEDIAGSDFTIITDGTFMWNVTEAFYQKVRLSIANTTANAVNVTAQFNGKGV